MIDLAQALSGFAVGTIVGVTGVGGGSLALVLGSSDQRNAS